MAIINYGQPDLYRAEGKRVRRHATMYIDPLIMDALSTLAVDDERFANRSHLIEYLLIEGIESVFNKTPEQIVEDAGIDPESYPEARAKPGEKKRGPRSRRREE